MNTPERRSLAGVKGPALHLSSGVWAGLLSGLVVGGLGGRLAMFVLRLTSDPSLHGRLTDDDFTIGSFTTATLFLVGFTMAVGVIGGLFYLLIRGWLPLRRRPLLFALFTSLVGGAIVIEPGGIDFSRVEPHALSIVFFILLPGLYGMSVGYLAERLLARERSSTAGKVAAFVPLIGAAILGPFGVVVIALALVGWVLSQRFPVVAWWGSASVAAVGRSVLLVVTALSAAVLGGDIAEIL
jgi:hypothetical protein